MSHEINDNSNKAASHEAAHAEGLNLLNVHEGDKVSTPVEELSRRLEANEKAIAETLERVAQIALRAVGLQGCPEGIHFDTLRAMGAAGAAAMEPAYVEFMKHLKD
jgi:hypothetical protein